MVTATKIKSKLIVPTNIETVDYPQEVVDEIRKDLAIMDSKIAYGEDRSIESLALKLGIDLDNL
jgi:hypothetical protein